MLSTYSSISAIAEDVPFDEEDEEEGAEVEQSPASVKEAVVKTGFSFSDGSNLSPKSDSSESVTQNQIRAVPDLDPLGKCLNMYVRTYAWYVCTYFLPLIKESLQNLYDSLYCLSSSNCLFINYTIKAFMF